MFSPKDTAFENNPSSIKYHVKKYLIKNKERIKNKLVVDFPAGNGITSRNVKDLGGTPIAFDLFPEYFRLEDITCSRVNVLDGIPLKDDYADFVICQEGIEHFSDQFRALKEFSRILKKNGSLIITTPNYSNLRARLSYFLSESERFPSLMPPNEIDSVWMNEKDGSDEFYFGHVFLIGILKLRLLAKLAGFSIKHIQFTRVKNSSLLILVFVYPFIVLSNCLSYFKNITQNKNADKSLKKEVYGEIFRLNINPKLLIDGHLFIEFKKDRNIKEAIGVLKSVHKYFGIT
jgi:SAM-dependent methyltransferase